MQREQRSSSTNSGTTELRSGATTSRRLKHWRGKSHKLAKREARLFKRDRQWEKASPMGSSDVRWGSLLARPEHTPYRDQSPARRKVLCWLVEFAAYLMNRCDIGSDGKTRGKGCMAERTTHRFWNLGRRFCTCQPNQHEQESGEGARDRSHSEYSIRVPSFPNQEFS